MECKGCETQIVNNRKNRGLCPTCHADLELGRLVRKMEPGLALYRECDSWKAHRAGSSVYDAGKTPEEALKGAKK